MYREILRKDVVVHKDAGKCPSVLMDNHAHVSNWKLFRALNIESNLARPVRGGPFNTRGGRVRVFLLTKLFFPSNKKL